MEESAAAGQPPDGHAHDVNAFRSGRGDGALHALHHRVDDVDSVEDLSRWLTDLRDELRRAKSARRRSLRAAVACPEVRIKLQRDELA